jgi:hypothetical protein
MVTNRNRERPRLLPESSTISDALRCHVPTGLLAMLNNLNDISDIGTFTMSRAGLQAFPVEAGTRTGIAAGGTFRKDGAVIDVQKLLRLDGQCSFTGMIEEEKAQGQFFEIDLIPNDFNITVTEECTA